MDAPRINRVSDAVTRTLSWVGRIRIRNRSRGFLPYLILSALSITAYLNWEPLGQGLWTGVDNSFLFSPAAFWPQYFSAWSGSEGGSPQLLPSSTPFYFLMYLMYSAGIPELAINRFFFILPVLLRGVSIYFLLSSVSELDGTKSTFLPKFIPSVLFMLAPTDFYGNPYNGLAVGAVALSFGVLLRGLRTYEITCSLAFALSSLVLTSNLLALILFIPALFTLCVVRLIFVKDRSKFLSYLFKTVMLSIPINIFWLVGIFPAITPSSLSTLFIQHASSGLQCCEFTYTIRGLYPLAFYNFYSAGSLMTIGFLLVGLSSAILLQSRTAKTDYVRYSFAILLISSILFASGTTYAWFRPSYIWLSSHLVIFFARPWFYLFEYFLAISVMLFLTLRFATNKLSSTKRFKRIGPIVVIAMLISVAFYVSPVAINDGSFRPSSTFEIPNEYNSLTRYVDQNSQLGTKLLVLPTTNQFPSSLYQYAWAPPTHWGYPDFVSKLTPFYTFGGEELSTGVQPFDAISLVESLSQTQLAPSLGTAGQMPRNLPATISTLNVFGIHTIILHHDLELSGALSRQLDQVNSILANSSFFNHVDFGSFLSMYELKSQFAVPPVFVVASNQLGSDLVLPNRNSTIRSTIAYKNSVPTIIDGTIDSNTSSLVVINQKFDPGWVCLVNGAQLPGKAHIRVNGYANGWLIDKTGNLTVEIYYLPQVEQNWGYIISGCSAIVYLVMYGIIRRKALRKRVN